MIYFLMFRPLGVILRSLADYFRDDGMIYSAALSYFAMTAMVPLCLFLITLFGYVLGHSEEFLAFFTDRLIQLFPAVTKGITAELRKLITFKGLGKLSLLLYALMSFQLYAAIHKSMGAVFKITQRRTLLGSVFLSLIVGSMLISLVFMSFAITSAVPLIRVLKDYLPWLSVGLVTTLLVKYMVPLFLVQFAAVTIYMIIPKRKVRFGDALWGGAFTAVMLETAKHVFTWYISSVITLGTVYGSLSAFVVFLVWIYYASAIFLIGGEIVHNLGEGL